MNQKTLQFHKHRIDPAIHIIEVHEGAIDDVNEFCLWWWREIDGVNVFMPFKDKAKLTPASTLARVHSLIVNEMGINPQAYQKGVKNETTKEDA